MTEPAFDAANFVVQGFVAVHADRDDGARRTSSCDPLDALDNAFRLEAVGREVQNGETRPSAEDGVEDLVDVAPKKDFATGEIDPVDVGILTNQRDDLVRRQLVGR